MKRTRSPALLLAIALPRLIAAHPATPSQVIASYGHIPLQFEANSGQTSPKVKFIARGKDYTLFLTPDEAILSLRRKESAPVLRIHLAGANPRATVHGENALPGTVNYFIGNNPSKWRTGIATYSKVRYGEIYPGIDLVYYGSQSNLEYDFVLAPGARPSAIQLQIEGAAKTRIETASGDLILSSGGREIRFLKPIVYQTIGATRAPVSGNFIAHNNRISFQVGSYDRSRPLVIDPQLAYSTFLGGSDWDTASAIAVDATGAAYITGVTCSANFPTPAGLYPAPNHAFGGASFTICNNNNGPSDGRDVFVTKLDPAGGAIVYSTYLGGAHQDNSAGIAVDQQGNAYIGGTTFSQDFPVTAGALQSVCAPVRQDSPNGCSGIVVSSCPTNASGFVTKLNPSGSALVYSTFIGGSGLDVINGIAVNAQGEAYIAGSANSVPYNSGLCGSLATNFVWPTTPNAYIHETVTDFPGTPATIVWSDFHQTFTKFSADGSSLIYSTDFGSQGHQSCCSTERTTGIAIDAAGRAHIVGYTMNAAFPTTADAFQPACPACKQVGTTPFVTVFDPALSGKASLVASTFLGGDGINPTGGASCLEQALAVAADSAGNSYVTGQACSANFPTTPGAFQPTDPHHTPSCAFDTLEPSAFVAALKPALTSLIYSTYLGGAMQVSSGGSCSSTTGNAIAVDANGSAYVTGSTNAPDFPLVNSAAATPANSGSPFAAGLDPTGAAVVFSTFLGTGTGSGAGIVTDSSDNIYVAGSICCQTSDFTTTSGSFQPDYGGGPNDAFVAKITAPSPVFTFAGVVNAASFVSGGLVPGGIATLFGSHLTSATGINLASGLPLATELLHSSVRFDIGVNAPIFAVDNVNGQQQINFQVPWELAGHSSAGLQVVNNGASSPTVNVPVLTAQPGVFVVLHANFQLVDQAHPATGGEVILIFCTNLGAVNPAVKDGEPSTGNEKTVSPTTVTIGNAPAKESFSGLASGFVGLYQVNAQVPTGLTAKNQPLVVSISAASSKPVLLPVK